MPALALLKFGPVHLQDAEGFDVTERSTVGAGSYTYWLASAGNMSSSVRRLYPPVSQFPFTKRKQLAAVLLTA